MSIPVHCAHTHLVDPNTLEPNPANPNRHSAHQIQLLAPIIQDQGWRNPVTVSKRSGLIVRGHGRLEAALLLGCETIPVDEQDYATEAEELADLLADNRLSELAELDEDDLRRVLASIGDADPDFDLELTGFMFHDLRDWMQALQLMGVAEVDYSITRRTKKIGIGRVLHGKRLLELCRRAASVAGTRPPEPPSGDPQPGSQPDDDQPQAVPDRDARRPRKRGK